MGEDYEISIPLKKEYFELIKSGDKTIHIDKKSRDLKYGDIVRFMNGYNPENGVVFKRIFRIVQKQVREIDVYELCRAQVTLDWLLDYVDNKTGKWVHLYILDELKGVV